MATLLVMRPVLSKASEKKEKLPTIREDECEDLEQEVYKAQRRSSLISRWKRAVLSISRHV